METKENAVWVFALSAPILEQQADSLKSKLGSTLNTWNSHGSPLRASIELLENIFLVVSADASQQDVSGCAKDSLRKAVVETLSAEGVQLANHSAVFYRDAAEVKVSTRKEFIDLASSGQIEPKTKVFDTTLQSYKDFNERFELAAESSWHWQLLPSQ